MSSDAENQSAERRASVRVPLDIPHFISVRHMPSGMDYTALLEDCSRGGVRIGVPVTDEVIEWNNAEVEIRDMPGALGSDSFAGIVCWVRGSECGVRFYQELPVSDEELASIIQDI
jgi:PilZ domain.